MDEKQKDAVAEAADAQARHSVVDARAKPHGRNPSGKETSAVMVEIRVVERMREAWHVRV